MNEQMLRERVEDILNTGNDKLLRQFFERELRTNRRQIVPLLSTLVEELEGRQRLTFLEGLLVDDGPDLIPVFIAALLAERNHLFAKSILLIYRNLEHFEAIAALDNLRGRLPNQLDGLLEKVMEVLRGRHHHRFFMQAFSAEREGGEALETILADMLEKPNSEYKDFFLKHLRRGTLPQQLAALRGLVKVGEGDLLEELLGFLGDAAKNRERTDKLRLLLLNEAGYAERVPGDYASLFGAIVGWDEEKQQQFVTALQEGRNDPAASLVRLAFGLREPLWLELRVFFDHIFSGEAPTHAGLVRLKAAFDDWEGRQEALLETACHLLGCLRRQASASEDLTQKIEAVFGESDPLRPVFMVAYLKGCQSKNALKMLQAYISFPPDDHVLSVALEALGSFQLEMLPPQVINLLHEHESHDIHRQVMELIVRAGFAEMLFEDLLVEFKPELAKTAAQVIAAHKVPEGEICLGKLLEQVVDDDQALGLIEALGAFPSPETGEAVAPFFQPGNPKEIRDAALQTLLRAGGPRAFATVLDVLALYPTQKRKQLSAGMCRLLADMDEEEYPEDIVWAMEFWTTLLCEERDPEVREWVLTTLRKVDWKNAHHPSVWVESLREIAENRQGKLESSDCMHLKTLAYKVESKLGLRQGAGQDRKSLTFMLDKVDDPCHHGSAGAFRRLNLMFKPHMLEDYPYEFERLINSVCQFYERNQGVPELIKIAISLSVRIGDPRLMERVDACLADPDPGVVQFADRAVAMMQQRDNARPVRSIHVVDDTRLITKTLHSVLSKAGFEVDIDNHPSDGMARLTQKHYDLGIVDLIMPLMDGVAYIREIRERRLAPDRIIVITSSRNAGDHQRANALGIDGLLLKPFPMGKLVALIENLAASV